MPSFRLITEGVTDQVTLEYILSFFYKDTDIDVERLQPPGDETDRYKQKDFGGWGMVFQYLKSIEFKEAVDFADYFIIQIDSDVSPEFDVPHQEAGTNVAPEDLFEKVKEKLIAQMDGEFYDRHRSKFLFAISIHSIECWFLPLYFKDNRKSKTLSCLQTLNRQLKRQEGFTIDSAGKRARYYEKIVKKFKNKKTLVELSGHNTSFRIFLNSLPAS